MDKTRQPKHDYNLNCLSYGTNLLIKLDNVDVLRAQFERFENHFRNDENVVYDVKLPLFIIETFSKLWKLWIDFPEDLQQAIDEKKFHEVFVEMSSFFNKVGDPNQQTGEKLICPVPQKAATNVSKQTMKSAELKTASPSHQFPDPKLNGSSSLIDAIHSRPLAIQNEQISHLDSIVLATLHCTAAISSPSVDSKSSSSLLSGCSSSRSPDANCVISSTEELKLGDVPVDLLLKLPTEEDRHCGPCCRDVGSSTEEEYGTISEHLDSVKHRKSVKVMTETVINLEQNKMWIVLKCTAPRLTFTCIACNLSQTGANCLNQHCKSKNHMKQVEAFSSLTPSSASP